MAELHAKIKNVLDESRILILGVQVLVGFSYNTCFQHGFEKLPASAHTTGLVALVLLLVSFAGLVSTISYHWIGNDGNSNSAVLTYATRAIEISLAPFALGLGLAVYTSFAAIYPETWGAVAA